MGLGRDRAQSVLLSRQGQGRVLRKLSRRHSEKWLLDGRGDRGGRRRRTGRTRRADLCKARWRPCRGDDEHQRGQGGRDRRGLWRRGIVGRGNADEMRTGNNGTRFLSNNAGGILGGISTGQPVVVRFAVKPTSSILSPRKT